MNQARSPKDTRPTPTSGPRHSRLAALAISLGTLTVIGLAACAPETETRRGFRLPDGNAELGREAFIALACHRCHTVDGVELPDHGLDAGGLELQLGGEIHYVKTYGDLLTSITNPEHLISEKYRAILEATGKTDVRSAMPSFNRKMTVQQLIDIITFLDSRYRSLAPDYSDAIYF